MNAAPYICATNELFWRFYSCWDEVVLHWSHLWCSDVCVHVCALNYFGG